MTRLRALCVSPLAPWLCVVAVLSSGCGPGTTYVTAQPPLRTRTIAVSGTARVELVPDEACIELVLAARDPSMAAAHAQLTGQLDRLLGSLRAEPGWRVERGAVRYAPDYEADGRGGTHLKGHVATAQVNVRLRAFAAIPDVVGRAAREGLDRVDVVFYASDLVDRKTALRTRALEVARGKAQDMARTLGVRLGEVVAIREGESTTNASVTVANYVNAVADVPTDAPASPGAIPLTMTVSLEYALE